MMQLTHRYMLEPLSGEKPAMILLAHRFLMFMDKIKKITWLYRCLRGRP